jgi:hypothetical protein
VSHFTVLVKWDTFILRRLFQFLFFLLLVSRPVAGQNLPDFGPVRRIDLRTILPDWQPGSFWMPSAAVRGEYWAVLVHAVKFAKTPVSWPLVVYGDSSGAKHYRVPEYTQKLRLEPSGELVLGVNLSGKWWDFRLKAPNLRGPQMKIRLDETVWVGSIATAAPNPQKTQERIEADPHTGLLTIYKTQE